MNEPIIPQPVPALHPQIKDITGQRFGRLVAISYAGRKSSARWLCQCDCGNHKVVSVDHLRNGDTRSCGCLRTEATRERSLKHGQANKTPEYKVWCGMLRRCYNSHERSYPDYGGRGITVCDQWHQFENFFADLGPRPTADHSIERIDTNGPYSPDNTRWATKKEQDNNRRSNIHIEFQGEILTLSQWAERYEIKFQTLWARIKVYGWPVERALTEPVNKK